MPETYYREALKLGQRDYRACVAAGRSPCLPVLDDFVSPERSAKGTELGIVQIPMERIVGTKTRGRVNSFAPNFMPVLAAGTEFSAKWEALCSAHMTDGIREPIKAYEYMNRFYVEEGNKRVSVLKFFGAVSIPGQVIRVLPERSDSKETEIYYEFLAFYKYSKINFLEFSKKGSYLTLQQVLGKKPEEEWDEDERRHFAAVYHYFEKAYLASGGGKLQSTVGDAMLSYLKVYGYPALENAGEAEIRKNLNKMWEEVALQQEQAPIEVKTDPAEEKKQGLLSKVLTGPALRKVAFVYDKTPETSGWVLGHEQGRQHVQQVFDGQIETIAYPNAMESDPNAVLEQAIADGCKLIFTTSPRLLQASLHAAVEHPEVVIMNCALNKSHRYIRSYYARMYEAKFIIGAIAGSLTESGRLGYVCDYPIYGQIAGINAFALGAQMTNPRAKVYLEWSSVKGKGAEEAAKALMEQKIHLISSQDTARLAHGSKSSFGLACVHGERRERLATPVWKWGVYYEQILRGMLNKTVQSEYENSSKALNYYWGMSAGVIDIEYGKALPEGARRLADYLKESLRREGGNPFLTPLRRQDGVLVGEGQPMLNLEQIIGMDYLVENVIGSIPAYGELSPIGQSTVDMAGVEPAMANAEETDKT